MVNKIQGRLEEITLMSTVQKKETISSKYSHMQIVTKLRIKTTKSVVQVDFPGIVFPNSLGNKVNLEIKDIEGICMSGYTGVFGKEYVLDDLDLGIKYEGIVNWSSY